jgi:hypothetical protein
MLLTTAIQEAPPVPSSSAAAISVTTRHGDVAGLVN